MIDTTRVSASALQTPAEDRATEFVAVDAGTEQYSGGKLLVAAYALVWAVLMAWIFLLWRKQQTLGKQLDELERAIARATDPATGERAAPAPKSAPPAAIHAAKESSPR